MIDNLKKAEMAEKAQELMEGSGWLPEPLRMPGRTATNTVGTSSTDAVDPQDEAAGEETAPAGGEPAMVGTAPSAEDEAAPVEAPPIAAE